MVNKKKANKHWDNGQQFLLIFISVFVKAFQRGDLNSCIKQHNVIKSSKSLAFIHTYQPIDENFFVQLCSISKSLLELYVNCLF